MATMRATAGDAGAEIDAALAAALFDAALPGEADSIDAAARIAIVAFVRGAAARRHAGTPSLILDAAPGIGGTRRRLALAIVNDDMPFLVDSVASAITAAGLDIDRLLHPIVDVARAPDGTLLNVADGGRDRPPAGMTRESIIYIEFERVAAKARGELQAALLGVLADVRAAVDGWPAMLRELRAATRELAENPPPVAPHAAAEATAFLDWLAADNFTLLGVRRTALAGDLDDPAYQPEDGPGLGLLRDPAYPLWRADGPAVPPDLRRLLAAPDPLLITKAGTPSTVHRRVNGDLIAVKRFDHAGRVVGETRFLGLFTSAALAQSPRQVPLLRRKVGEVIDALGFAKGGHTGKALVHVLEGFPREELFETTPERLQTMALGLLSLLDRPRPKLFARADPFGRFVSVLVYVPRDDYTSGVRESAGRMLVATLGGRLSRYEVELRAEGLARVHYIIDTDGAVAIDEADLDRRLTALVRGWDEALETALLDRAGGTRAARLTLTYARTFSASYRAQYSAAEAANDILLLSTLDTDADRAVDLYRRDGDAPNQLRLKIYRLGQIIALSDAVPVLENFGLRVIEEFPFDLAGGSLGWIHDFLLEAPAGVPLDATCLDRVEPALQAVLVGGQENDGFNALVIAAGLDAEAVGWLRAYFRYLRQIGVAYGLQTVVDALRRYPALTQELIGLFRARFALDRSGDADAADARIEALLADVAAIDDDRILRLYRSVVMATLRTNAFVPGGPEALAFKLDSGAVPDLPAPVPYREIWVFSPRVEGIHLRAGRIARGGLRWSDRRDDFRTEVLGLVKAQKVKNTVIVPTGSKGGFYPKHLPNPANRDAWLAEGTEAYRIYIRALLSVTDNLAPDGTVLPPAEVVCHDAADPYLVVAADKGTATFSDIANAISLERGFWLGDAFASGGKNGYDHKAMAITARGAWISVQRHFRELGVDVQTQPIRVVGCGDMSGDVFGNGMLLSRTIRLIAAFDHRHIFLDPEPEAAVSFAERQRLFALPRSSWDDYDKGLISAGGGVFPRSQKAIPLSAEVQAALGIAADTLSPDELIVAILKARADLLWFGGIGTYVKASFESNVAAGDRANDGHRVDATDLGAKVVGEGANLGLTQAARIEYAGRGGRINTDFIDNSAGVDCSDNEVNIKIALGSEVAAGRLTLPARDDLLVAMTDDVAALVLRDNTLQTQALSIAEHGGAAAVAGYLQLLQTLEISAAQLDRRVEGLASDEQLVQRARTGHGLERPELAVIMAYAKMAVYEALVDCTLVDDPMLVPDLYQAFPQAMQDGFAAAIDGHRLRRELIATKLANALINRGGLALPFELAEELGVGLAEVAGAFVAARALFDLPGLWAAIEAADVPGPVQLSLNVAAVGVLRGQMADLLRSGHGLSPSTLAARLRGPIDRMGDGIFDLLRPEPKAQIEAMRAGLSTAGAPNDIAERLLRIAALDGAVGVGLLAADLGVDPREVARAYTRLGEALGLDWAMGAAMALRPDDPWERLLQARLIRDFEHLRIELIGRVAGAGGDPQAAVEAWLAAKADRVARVAGLVARARSGAAVTTAMLAHVDSQARSAIGG